MGVYGAISAMVARRRREFGIRLALGGDARSIMSQLSRHVLTIVVAGAAVGGLGAFALVRVLGSRFAEIPESSLQLFWVPALILTLAAFAAAAIPAWRAVRLPPSSVLSSE